MARVFLSYDSEDRSLARVIEKGLKARGHQSVWGVDELLAGRGWGELMPVRIASADALVALITPNSAGSRALWCEIGAARALGNTDRRTALLPVVIGLENAPRCADDILVLHGKSPELEDQETLITEIDSAIKAHVAAIEAEALRTSSPKVFVSHRHKDQDIAGALTETLRSAFNLQAQDIRCTSVQPYRLPFGKNTSDRLRDEIGKAQVVLGILSPDTAESSYVMFELGAAWSQRIYTCPLLARGAEFSHIPGPIYDLAPARLWESTDCHQLLDNLQAELDLARGVSSNGAVADRISALTKAATRHERVASA